MYARTYVQIYILCVCRYRYVLNNVILQLCICIYIYIYTHMHTYIYIHVYICVCVYRYMYMHVYLRICLSIYPSIYPFIYRHMSALTILTAMEAPRLPATKRVQAAAGPRARGSWGSCGSRRVRVPAWTHRVDMRRIDIQSGCKTSLRLM